MCPQALPSVGWRTSAMLGHDLLYVAAYAKLDSELRDDRRQVVLMRSLGLCNVCRDAAAAFAPPALHPMSRLFE